MDALARSVAGQWQRYGGHASIFLDAGEEVVLTITELDGGRCRVDGGRRSVNLMQTLAPLSLPPDVLPEIIARINLGHELEFRDQGGVGGRLRYDPRAARFVVEQLDARPRAPTVAVPPLLCPRCTAVLLPWHDGQQQQTCPICGCTVTHS